MRRKARRVNSVPADVETLEPKVLLTDYTTASGLTLHIADHGSTSVVVGMKDLDGPGIAYNEFHDAIEANNLPWAVEFKDNALGYVDIIAHVNPDAGPYHTIFQVGVNLDPNDAGPYTMFVEETSYANALDPDWVFLGDAATARALVTIPNTIGKEDLIMNPPLGLDVQWLDDNQLPVEFDFPENLYLFVAPPSLEGWEGPVRDALENAAEEIADGIINLFTATTYYAPATRIGYIDDDGVRVYNQELVGRIQGLEYEEYVFPDGADVIYANLEANDREHGQILLSTTSIVNWERADGTGVDFTQETNFQFWFHADGLDEMVFPED